MRISTNMSAWITCNQLRKNDNSVSAALERLSSGYKINNAGDDPVGSAISNKMKAQIRGLSRANQNASDGISVVQTAEGALTEITAMLQRIRELSVQGASDINTEEDHASIMNEISQLEIEIDRIANDTEFNSKPLLNGSLSRDTYTNRADVKVSYTSDNVKAGNYYLDVSEGTRATLTAGNAVNVFTVDGTISINGEGVNIKAGDKIEDVMAKVTAACDKTDVIISKGTGNSYTYTSKYIGASYQIEIEASSPEIATQMGLNGATYTAGKNPEVQPDEFNTGGSGFSSSAIFIADGNEITIKASEGFEMHVSLSDEFSGTHRRVQCYVLDTGTMTIQLGANEAQEMEIELPEITCKTLGIDKINAYTSKGSSNAITMCDKALSMINQARSRIGAYENRLESSISSLDVTEENLTSALSRIKDVDMAEEMTNYTTQSVLSQAATSMLSQANQQPEKVLQLLQ